MIQRPTFFGFETAKRSISNAQFGLDTVGNNMANISTPGYTRQRLDQVSWSMTGASKHALNHGVFPGMGAVATGITQLRDPFLDARYRQETSNFGTQVVHQSGMTDLKKIFDEAVKLDELGKGTGLDGGLSAILSELVKLQQNPGTANDITVFRETVKSFCKTINDYANQLDKVRTQQMEDIDKAVSKEINPILEKIAKLNEQITQCEVYGNPANELRDERNYLLDELSSFVDIKVTETDKKLTSDITITYLTVSIRDTNPPVNLVDKDQFGQFAFNQNGDTAEISFTSADGTAYNASDMDAALKKGGIRGYLDIINGDGIGGNYRGIPYAQEYLDNLAVQFADIMNTVNTTNTDGTIDTDYLIANTSDNSQTGITAKNIGITNEWVRDPTIMKTFDPANPDNTQDITFIAKFVSALQSEKYTVIGDLPNLTFHDTITGFEGIIGLESSSANNLLGTSSTVCLSIDDQRQSLSGVSENEEAVSMMQYSNYYNAAVRYMTTIDEALDTLINGMGRVGR